MHWKIGQFVFDANNNVLVKQEQEVLLEPKVAYLLSYFCQNPQRAISRDELIEHVWHGQVVSDSAVNRIIVKLRKALDDNDKIKRFIVTVPKIGYRLAIEADTVRYEEQADRENNLDDVALAPKESQSAMSQWPYLALCLVSVFAFLMFLVFKSPAPTTYTDAKVSPLSRLSTTQFGGAMSLDQRYLAFSAPNARGINQLHIQDNNNHVTHVASADNGAARMPYWSDDGRHLFYIFYRGQECEIHQLDISDGVFSDPQIIYQCIGSQIRSIVHLPTEKKLLFVERTEEYSPWLVYSISLHSIAKNKVAQPMATGKGNYYIDRDRKTNRTLLLHEPTAGASQIFELKIADNSYHSLLKLPYMVNSALWGHALNDIVHPGEHPSYDLVATSLATGQQQVLYSDSRRITDINRINNGKDYLFSSYIVNRDIQLDGKVNALSNSSVMDYLPAISNDSQHLAFISKRSGYSKLWLQKIGTNQLLSIELEDKGRLFYQLVWSYDDKKILANTNKGMVIYDIAQLKVHKVIDLENTVAAVGWYSDEQVHYSEWHKHGWQVNLLNLNTNQHQLMDKALAFVLANKVDGTMEYLNFDQQLSAEWQGIPLDSNSCSDVLRRYRISWQLHNNRIYCRNTDRNAIVALDGKGQESIIHQAEYIPHYFTISNEHWATWKVSSYASDLIRTNFDEGS